MKMDITKDPDTFQQVLGVRFNKPALLEQSLVHSSFINESPASASSSNERLEFLGDAVLGVVVAEKLYQDFPDLPEGELTRLRARLVRRETLAELARSIELGKYLSLGRGEESSGGRDKPANLAGALEALIAAIYLDQGLAPTRAFILRLFSAEWQSLKVERELDYKSQLQELIQSRKRGTPGYYLLETSGPPHDRTFTVEVRAGTSVLGKGSGKSKKAAETEAARLALQQLTRFTD